MRNNESRFGFGGVGPQSDSDPPIPSKENGLSFITTTEMIDLPTKGRFYPVNHPLHGKTAIEIKHMTAKEEDILSSRSLIEKGVALDKLIQSLIVDKTIPTDSLAMSDRNAILIAARISGYGPEYKIKFTCPSCGVQAQHTFDLMETAQEANAEEENPVELDENCHFTLELPKTKWSVKCRILDGSDEKKIIQNTLMGKKGKEITTTEQLKMIVVGINNVYERSLLEKAVEAMPVVDSKFLRNEYEKVSKNVSLRGQYNCKSCDYEEVVEVPLTQEFFWFK